MFALASAVFEGSDFPQSAACRGCRVLRIGDNLYFWTFGSVPGTFAFLGS
ncbi:unnamed protein product [Ixodes persulcatus]